MVLVLMEVLGLGSAGVGTAELGSAGLGWARLGSARVRGVGQGCGLG